MASKHGDQKDLHDPSSPMSEADSGRGLSVADASSPDGENQRHVSANVEPGMPVQTGTPQDGQSAAAQEPYSRERKSQEGESENDELYDADSPETIMVQPSDKGEDPYALWQSIYNRQDNVFQLLFVDPASGKWRVLKLRDVSVNRVSQEEPGNVTVHVTGREAADANKTTGNGAAGNQQRDVLKDLQDLSLSDQPVVLSYRRSSDVSPNLPEEVRKRGAGKSPDVQRFFSFIAEHLREFGEVMDCYILPLQNGLLISQAELTVGNIDGAKLTVAQTTARGTMIVLLNPEVSQDMSTTYRPETQDTPGNFEIRERLGKGAEGPVHNAADIESDDEFAVKKIPLAKFDREAAAAFLKLTGSEHTCRPYGLVLDEENDSVLFLMEKVRGETLRKFLKDQTEKMKIPLAVDYTIDILTGLKYINSQEMMHSDVAARNVIIDGRRATLIDLTGAKKRGRIKGWDEAGALCLLNSMLRNEISAGVHLDKSSNLWKASADHLAKFNPTTLKKLEELLEKEAKTPLSQTLKVDELLPVLKEIQEDLKGLPKTSNTVDSQDSLEGGIPSPPNNQITPEGLPKISDTVDSQDSLEGGIPSPPNIQITPESAAKAESMEGLKKRIEELTEEKEKYRKGLSDAGERLQEKEKRIKELHESRNQLSDQVRVREEEFDNLVDVLKVSRESEKEWKAKVEDLEADHENQEKMVMLDRAEQDKKELKDELDALKAEIKKLQDRAEQDEDPRAEE